MSLGNGNIRFGEFLLDSERFLYKNGRPVPLTPKALDLLGVLIENRGRVVKKDELLERVWSDSFVEEGNLAYTIRLLRKALGDDASAPSYIESVPRRGYRFIAKCSEAPGSTLNEPAVFLPQKVEEDHGLIGRKKEIADLTKLLGRDSVRFVTLTGTGGTGKTRLAREIADNACDLFPDGIFFVELATVSDPQRVLLTIAQELGIQNIGTRQLLDVIFDHFQGKSALLVLDNFEQILPAGVQLAQLLRNAATLKILVTSREPLKLTAEKEYRVPPLDLPAADGKETIAELMRFGAVRLFVERAKGVRPDLELANERANVLSGICRKLDGLPLALELAASRTKVLSLEELLAKLENCLALLTGGSRDAPTRQQTMSATIEWSYGLLTELERWVFETLSVFEGGFTFEAAENILIKSGDDEQTFSETEIVDAVTSLADKGLILSERFGDGQLRFRMLVVVKDYALEMLENRGAGPAARLSHAVYFLDFSETAAPHLFSFQSPEWLGKFEVELDNIRAAIRWSLDNIPEFAARILAAVRHLSALRVHTKEARYWLEEVLKKSRDLEPGLRSELLTGLGVVCQYQRDLTMARAFHEQSLEISRQLSDRKAEARALRGIGAIDYMEMDLPPARARIKEALAISRAIGDEFGEAASLARLGDISNAESDHAQARTLILEALGIFRKLGYKQGIASKIANLSITEFSIGDFEAARQWVTEGLEMSIEIGDVIDIRVNFEVVAALMVEAGNYQTAARLSGVVAARCEDMVYFHEPVEQSFRETYVAKLRKVMSDAEFNAAVEEGRRLPVAEAVALANDLVRGAEANRGHLHIVRRGRT